MTDLLNGFLVSWRKTPLFAPETEGGSGDGSGDGGEGNEPGTSEGGGNTVLAGAANEGEAVDDGAGEGGAATDADPRDSVPEDGKYEFSFDENQFQLSEDAQTQYSAAFKDAGLTQKQADAVVAAHTKLLTEVSESADKEFEDTIGEWLNEAKTDKELGADWNATLATANRALKQFGDETLVQQLDNTGLGNHPSVLRFLSNIGKAISEDRFSGGDTNTDDAAPTESRWYGGTTPQTKKG